MTIRLNNKQYNLDAYDKISVKDLLSHLKYSFPMIIVKINGELVKKEAYETAVIKDGDVVAAIHLIGGG